MNIELETIRETPVAHLFGDIDMSNVKSAEDAMIANVTNKALALVVDLTNVTYLDSAGIRLLFHLENRLHGRQQRLIIVLPPRARTTRTLEASGAIGSLEIVRSVDEAFLALR